jgi:NADPH:quinone reductase-like Zn-dependent oxidoreductase
VFSGQRSLGGFAEYGCATEDRISLVAAIPDRIDAEANISFEDAAAVPVAVITFRVFVIKVGSRGGHKVLVDGASGGVGAFGVQITGVP